VRAWFLKASWWQLSLALGAVVGAVRFAGNRFLEGESWTESAISAAVGGLIVGLVLGPMIAGQNHRVRQALGTDDPAVLRRAMRAARWGPAPEDPVQREEARRVALVLWDHTARQRRWGIPLLVLMAAAPVALAVLVSDARVLVLLVPTGVLAALLVLMPRRFERRAELLRDHVG
jgi:hypothetical protein